jgi:uncharacterized protein YggE
MFYLGRTWINVLTPMPSKLCLSVIVILLSAGSASAQGMRTIAVIGHAEEKASVKAARTLQINVTSHEATASLAYAKLSDALRAMKQALNAAGAEKNEIKEGAVSMSANYDYSKPGLPPTISGYQLVQPITVHADNDQILPRLIDAATAAGATSVSLGSVSLGSGEQEATSDESLQKTALEDAHTRATQLAKASGATLGDVLSVSTVEEASGGAMSEHQREEQEHRQGGAPQQKKLELKVVYSIK